LIFTFQYRFYNKRCWVNQYIRNWARSHSLIFCYKFKYFPSKYQNVAISSSKNISHWFL